MTDTTSAIGMEVAGDKRLAHRVLADAGLPVPEGRVAASAAEALEALRDIAGPVVVKPLAGHQGENVHIELTEPPEVVAAYAAAAGDEGEVLVESYIPGKDYRVLVVGGRVAAAAELTAACLTGDGTATVTALVERVNADPARGEGHDRPLTRLALGPTELALLARQGHDPGSVPAAGERRGLRRNANLSTGGTSRDVTDDVHPDLAAMCVRAAAAVGMDVCGIDLRLPDAGSAAARRARRRRDPGGERRARPAHAPGAARGRGPRRRRRRPRPATRRGRRRGSRSCR